MISELVFRYLDYFYLVKDKTILVIIKDDNELYKHESKLVKIIYYNSFNIQVFSEHLLNELLFIFNLNEKEAKEQLIIWSKDNLEYWI